MVTGLSAKSEEVQVATLLTVIGEEAREVFSTFSGWEHEGDNKKIEPVLAKFERYCEPQKNIPFQRYRFNRRCQESGESYDQYRTALRKLADSCDFASITPDEILRDRLVFGIRDSKTRERLLREPSLTLKRTDEICHAAESMTTQLKLVEDGQGANVSAVSQGAESSASLPPAPQNIRECQNCGRRHGIRRRESCPAFGKTCRKCRKPNHFAIKCRSQRVASGVRAVDETLSQDIESSEETFPLQLTVHSLDDTQFVTLRVESGSHIRFQVDTGAQCNVVPLNTYKQATGDISLSKVTPTKNRITAYGGATLPVISTVLLRVWRGDFRCRLDCKLVDGEGIRPLLGRRACIGMKIIAYLDNDKLNKPVTGDAPVYTLEGPGPVSTTQLLSRYPRVFGPGVGLLDGKYRIVLDKQVPPVQHPPRRVPVPLRDVLKETLEDWWCRTSLPQYRSLRHG